MAGNLFPGPTHARLASDEVAYVLVPSVQWAFSLPTYPGIAGCLLSTKIWYCSQGWGKVNMNCQSR